MNREELGKKVDEGIAAIANSILEDARWMLDQPPGFKWPECAGETESTSQHPEGTPVWSGQVYGSSYGPALDIIIGEDMGLTTEEQQEVANWDLVEELVEAVWDNLPKGVVYVEDNYLWFRYIEGE